MCHIRIQSILSKQTFLYNRSLLLLENWNFHFLRENILELHSIINSMGNGVVGVGGFLRIEVTNLHLLCCLCYNCRFDGKLEIYWLLIWIFSSEWMVWMKDFVRISDFCVEWNWGRVFKTFARFSWPKTHKNLIWNSGILLNTRLLTSRWLKMIKKV